MQAVILVGGLGNRIKPSSLSRPKPLIDVCGKPFIYYLLKQLESAGFSKVLFLSGYLHQEFDRFINEYSSQFRLKLVNYVSDVELNTGARLLAASHLTEERFMLLYGDNYAPFALKTYVSENWSSKDSFICAYKNSDNYSKSNITLSNSDNLCLAYGATDGCQHATFTDIGYALLNRTDLTNIRYDKDLHFGQQILTRLISKNILRVNIIYQKYYTVGTMDRLARFRYFISNQNKKYLLLDRDGVLNEKPKPGHYIENYNQFKWKAGTLEALQKLKRDEFIFVVITNQAGIAREVVTQANLDFIHNNLAKESRDFGAELSYFYICPHHWDDNCDCRKPEPGLLRDASFDLGFDLTKSIFVGDSITDKEAAEKVGCKFLNLNPEEHLVNLVNNIQVSYNDSYKNTP